MLTCASCSKEINLKGKSEEAYRIIYGSYCVDCSAKASSKSQRNREWIDDKSYLIRLNKSKDNEKVWREKGYLSHK
jgi:hypothetical protein